MDIAPNPATNNPMSSKTPRENAALKPINDHSPGMINKRLGNSGVSRSNMANVNMVVGQGATPKTGDCGYVCPINIPRTGYMSIEYNTNKIDTILNIGF